jgi:hypothetical protein
VTAARTADLERNLAAGDALLGAVRNDEEGNAR